jgi:hypothetical protein
VAGEQPRQLTGRHTVRLRVRILPTRIRTPGRQADWRLRRGRVDADTASGRVLTCAALLRCRRGLLARSARPAPPADRCRKPFPSLSASAHSGARKSRESRCPARLPDSRPAGAQRTRLWRSRSCRRQTSMSTLLTRLAPLRARRPGTQILGPGGKAAPRTAAAMCGMTGVLTSASVGVCLPVADTRQLLRRSGVPETARFGEVRMEWFEQLTGVSPDGGSGWFEHVLLAVAVAVGVSIAAAAARRLRWRLLSGVGVGSRV